MGERLVCNQEVIGSIPFTSTTFSLRGGGAAGSRAVENRMVGKN